MTPSTQPVVQYYTLRMLARGIGGACRDVHGAAGRWVMTLSDDRLYDLIRFYEILDMLAERIGGPRILAECTGQMGWPKRGVYFFQEYGETRSDSGTGLRIVRVGTHALKTGSRTTLCNGLSQHRGPAKTGVGNHRGPYCRSQIRLWK